ncbi:hypothetical protein DFH09DRAFT_1304519 [Mycena vulgaris]|nr:hypothetical protein DFH09DRAFT_1304519 [Mycena vulgaris]
MLQAADGTLYNVYRQHLLLRSEFFCGMLTLPIPAHPTISLSDSTTEYLAKAKEAGLDGTSDATALELPIKFSATECEKFLEFVFNTKGWTADLPKLDDLCAILKTCHFFVVETGIEYAIYHLENHPELEPALRFRMGCDYHLTGWIAQVFDDLMTTPITEVSAEDEALIGPQAYRALARAQARVADRRMTLAVCPPEPTHVSWCHSERFCTAEWESSWVSIAGVLGALIKDELPGSEIHDKLESYPIGAMTRECHHRTCTNLRGDGERKSIFKQEEEIIDEAVEELMKQI